MCADSTTRSRPATYRKRANTRGYAILKELRALVELVMGTPEEAR